METHSLSRYACTDVHAHLHLVIMPLNPYAQSWWCMCMLVEVQHAHAPPTLDMGASSYSPLLPVPVVTYSLPQVCLEGPKERLDSTAVSSSLLLYPITP